MCWNCFEVQQKNNHMINQVTGKLMEDCRRAKTVVWLFSCFGEKNSCTPHPPPPSPPTAFKKKILISRAQVLRHWLLKIFSIRKFKDFNSLLLKKRIHNIHLAIIEWCWVSEELWSRDQGRCYLPRPLKAKVNNTLQDLHILQMIWKPNSITVLIFIQNNS